MSLTINHQTNDISATSGSVTIGGAAVGVELISTNTFTSAASSLDFTSISGYIYYKLFFALVTSNAGVLYIRVGIDGTYDTGSNYVLGGGSVNQVQILGGFSAKAYCGETTITHLNQSLSTKINSTGVTESNDASSIGDYQTGGGHKTLAAQNCLKVYGASGDIPSGTISLYGVKI
tara:strand:+ start:3140 stop:3667 length:528 start_codon:yes stop_codon:yes gene_type:complete